MITYLSFVFCVCRQENSGIWAGGSGTLKEFELYELRAKCKKQERDLAILRQNQDFYMDKGREWKGRALGLEKLLTAHGVPVPKREPPTAVTAEAANRTADSPMNESRGRTATAAASTEKENNAPTPTVDMQLMLEPGGLRPPRTDLRGGEQPADCKTQ